MSLHYERSAGVIPFRFGLGRCLSYLVIHSARVRNPLARWEFPKGRIEPGETPTQAAAREFQEETGITSWAFREGFDRDVSYTYFLNGRKHFKTVTYFIAEVFVQSAMTLSVEHIVDASGRWYRWGSFDQVSHLLCHAKTRRLFAEADAWLRGRDTDRPGSHPLHRKDANEMAVSRQTRSLSQDARVMRTDPIARSATDVVTELDLRTGESHDL
jgi:8-oxo-dGTP pyrophosphatase MutT (NUDIX family)